MAPYDAPQFHVTFAAPYSGVFDRAAQGRWATVSSKSGGAPVGLIWTNESDGFGLLASPASGGTTAQSDFLSLSLSAQAQGLSAGGAFDASKLLGGYTISDEKSGSLSGVYSAFAPMLHATPPVTAAATGVSTNDADASVGDWPNGRIPPFSTQDGMDTLGVTMSGENDSTVQDLVFSDRSGVYTRSPAQTWSPIPDDPDLDPTDGLVWIDVAPSFLPAYDSARAANNSISESDLEQYRADNV